MTFGPNAVITQLRNEWLSDAIGADETDGLDLEFDQWRFNVRASNAEPLLRLNVETRGNLKLMQRMTEKLREQIRSADN